MALNFPFEMFMAAQQAKNQNQNQMNQNIAGMGQSMGGTLTDLGTQATEDRKRKIVQQLAMMMQQQGQPMQGPTQPGQELPQVPDQSGKMMGLITQIDPAAGLKMIQEQQNQVPSFMGPEGQISPTQNPGFRPFHKMDADTLAKMVVGQNEKAASLAEKRRTDDLNADLRKSAEEIQRSIAEGRHEDALAHLETVRAKIKQDAMDREAAIKERSIAAKRTARVNAQKENAKYWFRNPVTVPPDPDAESSFTAEDEKRLQELKAKKQ